MHGESESNKQKTYVSAILYKILRMSVYFCPDAQVNKTNVDDAKNESGCCPKTRRI